MVVVERPRLTLLVAAVALIASVLLALAHLGVSTDQNKLFSRERTFFRDYVDFIARFPENEAVYVVVEPVGPSGVEPPLERWTGLADDIAARLRALPQHVRRVEERVPIDQLGIQGILFEPRDAMCQRIAEMGLLGRLVTGRTPLQDFFAGNALHALRGATRQEAVFAGRLADGCVAATIETATPPATRPSGGGAPIDLARLGAVTPTDLGYTYLPDAKDARRHVLLVAIYHQEDYTSLTAISETVEAIRAAVRAAARAYPEFTVGVTGRPALDADEMRTTDHDTTVAEIIAMGVVFLGLVTVLRSVWLALTAEIALAVGIGWTFGYATLAVGELNLLSLVFVIALIGIGMDYLIQILVRYRREARRYVRQAAIWTRVFRYVSPPITTACLGAAGAFLVSALTDFRGAAQLGIIAGGGLLLCLLAGYTVLPALLVLFPPKLKPVPAEDRYAEADPDRQRGWRNFITPAIWIALCLAGIPFMLRAEFDPNLLKLQSPKLESVKLVHKLQTWEAVVLSDDLDELRRCRAALAGATTVASTESIIDALDNQEFLNAHPELLPRVQWVDPPTITPADLAGLAGTTNTLAGLYAVASAAKPGSADAAAFQRAARELREFSQRAATAALDPVQAIRFAEALDGWQRGFVAQVKLAVTALPPPKLGIGRLPESMRHHFVSYDAATSKAVYALYVYPRADLWERAPLAAFVKQVEERVATVPPRLGADGKPGAPLRVTGIASNIYHSTAAIEHAFYLATGYALALIFILVLIDLRRLGQTLLAISVLALGLPMLVALMGFFGISWNFANFFGLPILIGAGHEYGVFMVHRYREVLHNPRRVWHGWDVSDRALLLCAFVTSSSFGFLILGQHLGIRSLGLVMAMGSACIYLATIMVVRPLLIWRIEHRGVYANGVKGSAAAALRKSGPAAPQ
jgi:predicted RND superfamily exporter protein